MKKICFLINLLIFTLFSCDKSEPDINYEWKDISLDNASGLTTIYMLDDETGYVGRGNTYQGVKEYIHHYTVVPFYDTLVYTPGNGLFYTEYVFEENHIPEPILFKTQDGGGSWQAIQTPFSLGISDMQFITEDVGYVATENEGVYKTSDGGSSWTQLIENTVFYYSGMTYGDPFSSVCFINEEEGFVYGDRFHPDILFSTRDGGNSWKCISIEYPPGIDGKHPTLFIDLEKLIFFNDCDTGYAVNNSILYKTTDLGENWKPIHDIGSNDPSTVYFTNPQNGYLTNLQVMTRDGGETWSTDSFKLHGENMVLIDNKEFYYTSRNRIIKKYVGERKPHYMALERDVHLIYDLFFPSENMGYALCSESTILKYKRVP